MSDDTFHAAALALFVALCIAAASGGARDNATTPAARRAALFAAQQPAPPHAATRASRSYKRRPSQRSVRRGSLACGAAPSRQAWRRACGAAGSLK